VVFKAAFGEQHNAFTWLGSHPESLTDFNEMMTAQRFNRLNWYDFYPVEQELLTAEGSVLMVDVGGAQGYELECFKKRFPQAKGELVLQDLPHVIDSIQGPDQGFKRMKHDFFTEQPVKGMFHDC
jgi:hypothetical protein